VKGLAEPVEVYEVTGAGPALTDRTEGNPFFLEESARALIETKVLAGESGGYRLMKAAQDLHTSLQIPATAQAILAARVDRLAPDSRPPPSSAMTCPTASFRPSQRGPRTPGAGVWLGFRPPSSCTRPASFPTSRKA